MLDTWHRLERVIKWTGLSVNSFALNIGLKRSENLYQIKKGNNGISRDLATLITTKYPSVSKAWLLTGEGEMFVEQVAASASQAGVPYYGMDILAVVDETVLPSPQFYISIPIFDNCDIAAQNNVESIVPGESYLVVTEQFKGIRTIRAGSNPSELLLLPANTQQYDPIVIGKSDIVKLFIVQGIIVKKNL